MVRDGGHFMRIHVASFDAQTKGVGGEDYNHGNCMIVRDLMQGQPGVIVQYWCEPFTNNDPLGIRHRLGSR